MVWIFPPFLQESLHLSSKHFASKGLLCFFFFFFFTLPYTTWLSLVWIWISVCMWSNCWFVCYTCSCCIFWKCKNVIKKKSLSSVVREIRRWYSSLNLQEDVVVLFPLLVMHLCKQHTLRQLLIWLQWLDVWLLMLMWFTRAPQLMLPTLFVNTAEHYLLMTSSCFIKLSVITLHRSGSRGGVEEGFAHPPAPAGEK